MFVRAITTRHSQLVRRSNPMIPGIVVHVPRRHLLRKALPNVDSLSFLPRIADWWGAGGRGNSPLPPAVFELRERSARGLATPGASPERGELLVGQGRPDGGRPEQRLQGLPLGGRLLLHLLQGLGSLGGQVFVAALAVDEFLDGLADGVVERQPSEPGDEDELGVQLIGQPDGEGLVPAPVGSDIGPPWCWCSRRRHPNTGVAGCTPPTRT